MKCLFSDGYNLTVGEYYTILGQNSNSGAYQIVDDEGCKVWVPEHYLS